MITCGMALVLLVDVSGSVDAQEFALQKQGVVDALMSPAVHRAIWQQQAIAVTIIEWESKAAVVVPWRLLTGTADAMSVALEYQAAPRSGTGSTMMGQALGAGLAALASAPCSGGRMVIDISGDGAADDRGELAAQRALASGMGVTINGLVIEGEAGLEDFYHQEVMLDGFVMVAGGFEDFARAMRQKLAQEIASR